MSDITHGIAIAQVQNLYARYAHALDEGRAADFMDCFTADAGMWPNAGPFQSDRGRFSRDALGAFVTTTNANRPRHIMLNVLADVATDGLSAKGTALFQLFDIATGEVRALGQYRDEAVQDADGTWRFTEKRVTFLWQSEAYKARAEAIPTTQ